MENRRKVFGIGLSRTGTMSLSMGLELLGFRSVHFPSDPDTRAELLAFLDCRGEALSLSVLETVDALTDTPVCCAYQALDKAYPGSKFILTTREEGAWLRSCQAYWSRSHTPFARRQLRGLKARVRSVETIFRRDDRTETTASFRRYARRVNQVLYGDAAPDADRFRQARHDYESTVHDYFADRPQSLLVMDICSGDGWNLLCPFLGVDIPSMPFPVSNSLVNRERLEASRVG
jgi:hypothetical protein